MFTSRPYLDVVISTLAIVRPLVSLVLGRWDARGATPILGRTIGRDTDELGVSYQENARLICWKSVWAGWQRSQSNDAGNQGSSGHLGTWAGRDEAACRTSGHKLHNCSDRGKRFGSGQELGATAHGYDGATVELHTGTETDQHRSCYLRKVHRRFEAHFFSWFKFRFSSNPCHACKPSPHLLRSRSDLPSRLRCDDLGSDRLSLTTALTLLLQMMLHYLQRT